MYLSRTLRTLNISVVLLLRRGYSPSLKLLGTIGVFDFSAFHTLSEVLRFSRNYCRRTSTQLPLSLLIVAPSMVKRPGHSPPEKK